MSAFYGQVEGMARSRGTRCGLYDSHISASVQSWEGSLTSELYYDENDELCVQVYHDTGSNMYGRTKFRGTVDRFVDMCEREMRTA